MAQANCLLKIPKITRTQPPVMAWSDFRGGCNGAQAIYPVPTSVNLCQNNTHGIGANDIDALWLPPNVRASVDGHCGNQDKPVRFYGSGHIGQGIDYPGLYQLDSDNGQKLIYDAEGTNNRIGANDIDVIHVGADIPWDVHLNNCCGGKVNDTRMCGAFLPGAQQCKEFLNRCTADQLKNDVGCQEMCRKDPLECDKIKVAYCSTDKGIADPWCSCMNIDNDPEYKKFVQKVILSTGQAPRIGCSPFGRCNTGIDLVNAFIPSIVKTDRNLSACPSYSTYIDQSLDVSGSNNVLENNQTATVVTPPPSPTNQTTPQQPTTTTNETSSLTSTDNKSKLLLYAVIILIAVLICYLAYGYYTTPREVRVTNNS